MIVEGVPYLRYAIRYTTKTGRKRRIIRWAPFMAAMAESFHRELGHDVKPGSDVVFRHALERLR